MGGGQDQAGRSGDAVSDITVEVVAAPAIEVTVSPAGVPGMSAYQHAVANGFEGTVEEWLESLQGQDAGTEAIAEAVEDYLTANPTPDASSSVKGIVQLAGDLGGTAAAPTVPGLADKADADHTHAIADVTGLQTALDGKATEAYVDAAIAGVDTGGGAWGEITGTLADQTDLATELADKSDVGHTHTASAVTDFDAEVSNNTDVAANTSARHTHANSAVLAATTASFLTADETKLDGIASGATANDTDANLKARGNHTGTQTASTISDFASAVAAVELSIAAGSAMNPHTTQGAARNSALPKNFWQYTGTEGVDDPTNAISGDEWILA